MKSIVVVYSIAAAKYTGIGFRRELSRNLARLQRICTFSFTCVWTLLGEESVQNQEQTGSPKFTCHVLLGSCDSLLSYEKFLSMSLFIKLHFLVENIFIKFILNHQGSCTNFDGLIRQFLIQQFLSVPNPKFEQFCYTVRQFLYILCILSFTYFEKKTTIFTPIKIYQNASVKSVCTKLIQQSSLIQI